MVLIIIYALYIPPLLWLQKVSDVKATAESTYANTEPSTKFTSPPKQDTEVHYKVAAGYKSDGKTVCMQQLYVCKVK